jgi:hypothetical protein
MKMDKMKMESAAGKNKAALKSKVKEKIVAKLKAGKAKSSPMLMAMKKSSKAGC